MNKLIAITGAAIAINIMTGMLIKPTKENQALLNTKE